MKSATASGGSYNYSGISTTVPTLNPAIGSPSANLIVINVASNFIQQYFALNAEPYPGYIQWKDPTTNNIVYTLRGTEPHYPTAQAHIQGNSASTLISTMGPIISNLSGGVISTSEISKISSLLTGHTSILSAEALTKVLGKGVNLQSITSLASKLIPNLSKGINGLLNNHLPKSVLDPGKVGPAMNDFTKNQSLLALKKQEMKKTVDAEPAEQQDAQIKAYNDNQAAQEAAAAANEPGFSGASGEILSNSVASTTSAAPISQNSVNPATGNFIGTTGETFLPTFAG